MKTIETESLLSQKKNERRRRLCEALVTGFPSKSDLEQMLWLRLDKNLNFIAREQKNLKTIVFTLIREAEGQGWVNDLLEAAYKENPRNESIQAILKEFFPQQNHNN
ncbi:hypothetical protein RIVM261_077260 [Rivularia sp. IAM M-261]|nr:hypothetical protein RIVM261_077260 [Rivularia sp. IAM M-261]